MIVLATTLSGCDRLWRRSHHRGTPVVVGDTMLRYPDGSTLAPGAGDIALVGQLEAETSPPFIIIAAHACTMCETPDAVLVRAPSAGRMIEGDRRGSHPYPGHAVAVEDGSVRAYSRVFWGECLPERPQGVLSFRSEFGWPGDEPSREVRITEVHGDSLLDWRTVPDVRLLIAAVQQVRARKCTELMARDVVSAP